MRITDAEIRRIAHMPEETRHEYFKKHQARIDFEAIISKARQLESVAQIQKDTQLAEAFDDVIASAVLWVPVGKHCEALLNKEDWE